jgi:hypothetical protein
MDLTAAGVSSNSMFRVVNIMAKHLGFEVRGKFAGRAVNQVVEEGGVAAEMQLMYKSQGAQSKQLCCTVILQER